MTDSDSDEGYRTPKLKPQVIHYGLKEPTPPPFAVDEKEQSTDAEDAKITGEGPSPGSRKRLQEISTHASAEGNSALIRNLEPNRPDLAEYERTHSKIDSLVEDDHKPGLKGKIFRNPATNDSTGQPTLQTTAPRTTQSDHEKGLNEAASRALKLLQPDAPLPPQESFFNSKPRSPTLPLPSSPVEPKPDSPFSWNKLIIPPSEGPTRNTLPALHPPTANANSPENHTSLPSLQTTLYRMGVPPEPPGPTNRTSPYSLPPVTTSPPQRLRNDFTWETQRPGPFPPPQIPPSPYSHMSPASTKDLSAVSSPASQAPYWRPPLKSDIHYLTSPYDTASPVGKSPAGHYPTPVDPTPPAGGCERMPFSPANPSPNGVVSSYKCRHPGCTAPPFQTQYLLNSHANVHSQDRPHFCPVDGCTRGVGGKGFKRKNEMIRHGLVHNSPGYVCPFCPDQQHKYPRPDNLQRHVRVHHVDKSRDDPALHSVLSLRPEGSTRGRRRRAHG
ncbi:uncharacterized protein BDW47DRAFT_115225 [Aspergillus candidus]|uniref:C2H2-type domain-containing protein n=1 Tax=Aspergillus candidus TaxID=41067 RepID=A0A2I2FLG1_ASPCN|nr:hypothetical protein BDW47DRAFT_115225 [Aspergillus candidus]PLB41462.1 hypothetical protein BDW47DRAFT_115225 [Aspergillus candidus]